MKFRLLNFFLHFSVVAPFKPPGPMHINPAVLFPNELSIWEVYINESVLIDNELVKDWTSSLNFLLGFCKSSVVLKTMLMTRVQAAIFSSVLSEFIIESKQMLEENPADVMVDALISFINDTANGTHTPYSRSPFSTPSYDISVNSLLFASLSASIAAALSSVVALQWVAEYDAATSRSGSSPEERAKRRQFRYGGMEKWKMGEIIAALPILLYCSLVLFFVGVAQWMWSVHTTVGSVVIGGILLGVTFYIVTTMLGVVFPSSPYRALIVRWIYVLFHLIFHPLRNSRQESSDSSSKDEPPKTPLLSRLDFKRIVQFGRYIFNPGTYRDCFNRISSTFRSTTLQARDGSSIDGEQKGLICDSLSWLARNISISQDSHHRLLLLAREALKLDKEQQLSKQFKEIPWSLIFRLLGDKYAEEATLRELTEEDEKDLTVLLQSLRNPRMGPFISPDDDKEYGNTITEDDTPEKLETGGPSPAYLLLRNAVLPGRTLSIEEQVKLRVGYLNQAHRVPRSLQGGEDFHSQLVSNGTTNMCDYLIPRLAEELGARLHDDDQDRVDTLICLAHLGQPPLQDFQLSLPLYSAAATAQRPSRLLYRLRCANWIQSQIDHPHLHAILRSLVVTRRRNSNLKFLWRFIATDEEVEEALTLVDAQHRQDLSNHLNNKLKNLYLFETLETFDKLIARGCDQGQTEVIVELLCHDIPSVDSPLYVDYFDHWVKDRIAALQDPWIRIIGFIAAKNRKVQVSLSPIYQIL
jgi:hypothetical protein